MVREGTWANLIGIPRGKSPADEGKGLAIVQQMAICSTQFSTHRLAFKREKRGFSGKYGSGKTASLRHLAAIGVAVHWSLASLSAAVPHVPVLDPRCRPGREFEHPRRVLLRVKHDVGHRAEEGVGLVGHVLAVVPAGLQDVVHVVADPHGHDGAGGAGASARGGGGSANGPARRRGGLGRQSDGGGPDDDGGQARRVPGILIKNNAEEK